MSFASDSVGIVTPQKYSFEQPLELECGRVLPRFELMVETYGQLNETKSNAILICHALSGHHHAAGYHHKDDKKPGWWDACIGPNKAIDTNKFFVVAVNNIGGCHGSTGPISPNPENDNLPYGPDFPLVTVRDWVRTHILLSDQLGIDKWYAIVGGSLGGMQALQWSIDYPDRLERCAIIASAPKLSAQNIAFNEVARQSILSDPDFHHGQYLSKDSYPRRGLILARMVGHITYLSEEAMKQKFGRDLKSGKFMYGFDVEFQVESYLRYQGERFSRNFDANTYLIMTKALDYFDPAREYESSLTKALANTKCRFLVISFTTDWRFSPKRSEEIVNALITNHKPVSYVDINAEQGHDSFLFPIPLYVNTLRAFLGGEAHLRSASTFQEPK
ncbi:homoserine O-succinyltransferase MetX [Acinetobacter nectaris]|uniref:homoserine O-succinyltransferase MetX n=1 Tax=Acinetobacter nectaris TaxID=1219382 RepID=UPI001F00CE64|nr:homoserine O-acetyltransferase [Acinetobacter nectaris]MCF9027735.1 homoserine O-acetyltransferase [Acinetobacter nectaris]